MIDFCGTVWDCTVGGRAAESSVGVMYVISRTAHRNCMPTNIVQ